jgi:hypothetical protein
MCFSKNIDLNFLVRVDTSGKFGSTLVVKIKKTQESTPSIYPEIRRT